MLRKARVATPLLVLGLIWGTTSPTVAQPRAPTVAQPRSDAPVHTDAPFIRDAQGRVVFFHGVNAAWKHAPYYPPSKVYGNAKSYFDDRDARFLADAGLNHVRLGVFFSGVMPEEGVIDRRYLDRIEDLVKMLDRRGVSVMLDFHQDLYNELFGGEGFPDWAVITDGIPPTNVFGFPFDYLTPAVSHVFDNFWLNRAGLQDRFAEAWTAVAKRFRNDDNVMGYDILNEPWAGTQGATCVNVVVGCPVFENAILQPFFEKIIAAIRTVDRNHIVFWEAQLWSSAAGVQDWMGLLRPIRDPANNVALSFHDYCAATLGAPEPLLRALDMPCTISETATFRTHQRAAARNDSASLLSEFGASDDVIDVARVAALADQHLSSWDYWAFGSWNDPTGNPEGEGLWTDDLDRPGSLKRDKALVLIRTYPQAVAGTPLSFSFDPDTANFTFTYRTDPSIHAPTVVFVPVKWHYPRGYIVTVKGPAKISSARNQPRLLLTTTDAGTVTVTVRSR